jgi:Short C-terminal domain
MAEELIAMQKLTPEGLAIVDDLARRHAVSRDAVQTLLHALVLGNGTQAQFNHPDLGGMGQWSQGGMIMVGDMFNQGLKYRVDTLCRELASLLRSQPLLGPAEASQSQGQGGGYAGVSLFVPGASPSSTNWWPSELGNPGSTGAQNNLQYACFPAARRLAIRNGGQVSVYDTGEHRIMGFSQQQSGDQSLTFTSQFGLVRVADLPLASPMSPNSREPSAPNSLEPVRSETPVAPVKASAPASTAPTSASTDDILTMIERLADLRQKNILTEEEFAAKKAELLNRL